MAQKSPEQRKSYHVTKAFKGLNTRPNRTALDSDEFAWLENIQPIGFGNLKVVANSSNVTISGGANVAWSNTVTELTSINLNNTDYVVAFEADGRAEYYNIATSTKGNVATTGTFSGSGMRMRQWKNERALIGDPNNGFYTWDGTNLVSIGSIGSVGITNTGSNYTEPPVVTVSAPNETGGVQATILASISNAAGTITNINITAGGTGYTSFPSVTIAAPSQPTGVQATAVVTGITSGAISSISITNPGYGYTTTAPSVTFSSGAATATAVVGSGIVTSLSVSEAGTGYTSAPTITFTGGGGSGAAAVAGPLTFRKGSIGITVSSGGIGYASVPSVVIGAPPGGGVQAVATAIMFGGIVTGVIVTNPGKGYLTAPSVSFSGGTPTTAATATAVLTDQVIVDVASFSGRAWIGQGRNIFYSAAGTYNDFVSVSAGVETIKDDTLHSNVTALISANNFLYVFGDDSINVFSDVRVGSTGLTSFTNTNVSASTGSTYIDGIFPYFRSLLFINQYGIFALVGATVTKISDALDGIIPYIDYTYPVTGGQVLVNNILCAAFNVYYNDPLSSLRPVQLVFFDKKWFVTSQGTVKFVTLVPTANKLWLYGSSGTNLVRLYNDSTTNISTTIRSALWPMEDAIRDKQALKFAFEATVSTSASFNVTVDSEYGSSPVYVMSNTNTWLNNLGNTIPWQNNVLSNIGWITGYGYSLYKSDAAQYGKYLGLTITCIAPAFTLNTLEMEHELRARF